MRMFFGSSWAPELTLQLLESTSAQGMCFISSSYTCNVIRAVCSNLDEYDPFLASSKVRLNGFDHGQPLDNQRALSLVSRPSRLHTIILHTIIYFASRFSNGMNNRT